MDLAVRKKRILIADDEPSIRRLYWRVLRKEGYEVILAASGEEAVRLAREAKPDLAVLDIDMPGMDGVQALQRIRSVERSLPVIFNTANSCYEENILCWSPEAYVVKSSELAELKDTIRCLLRRRSDP